MANSYEQLPQLLCHCLDKFRSAMKLSRGILKKGDAPLAIMPGGHKSLNGVDRGIEIRLPGGHHTSHRLKDGNTWGKKAHASDFGRESPGLRQQIEQAIAVAPESLQDVVVQAVDVFYIGKLL